MAIKTCLFDMGNVLVGFSHDHMCRNVAGLCGWTEDRVRRFLIDEGRQWQTERGELSEEQFCQQLAEAVGKPVDPEALRHAVADIFWLNESIVPVLHELKQAGRRLVLLSNTSITHLRFIEREFRVLELMDARVTSYEVGAMKPSEPIYQAALRAAGCEPHECFYTDDIPAYIEKGAALGIHSHLYTTTDNLRQALRDLNVLA